MMKHTPKPDLLTFILRCLGGACSITVTTVISILLIHVMQHDEQLLHTQHVQQLTPTYRVALFLGANPPALQAQNKGMSDMLAAHDITTDQRLYFHYGNPLLLQEQLKEAIASEPDAILTVGTLASQTATKFLEKRDRPVPLIFANVMNPVESGISRTTTLTGFNSTGIAEDYSNNLHDFLAEIRTVRPDLTHVKLLFNAGTPMLEQQAEAIKSSLTEQGVTCSFIQVFNLGEVSEKARANITEDDQVLIILRDYLATESLPTLVKICNDTRTTIFASDAYSVKQGAAAAHCIDEYEIGLLVGSHLLKVLKADKKKIGEIPITYLNASKLCSLYVNPFTMHKQGVRPSLEDLLTRKGIVISHR